jgi:hypothetical protein
MRFLQSFLRENTNPLYEITDDLDLRNFDMKTFSKLTLVCGNLDLSFSKIKSLENLKSVGGDLFFKVKEIKNPLSVN